MKYKKSDLRYRLVRHYLLILTASLLMGIILRFTWITSGDPIFVFSIISGYIALALLSLTLIIGPLKLLRGQPSPTNTYLRRDIGIMAGLIAIFHVIIGLNVHFRGKMLNYFFRPAGNGWLLRGDIFGMANYTGAVAGLLVLIILITSNNFFMKYLGVNKWKNIQRINYFFAVFTIVHGILFMIIENRSLTLVVLFSILSVTTLFFQILGVSRYRRFRG